jgi:hypothetical protein
MAAKLAQVMKNNRTKTGNYTDYDKIKSPFACPGDIC